MSQDMIANRYMIVSSLGSGGMADVYLAMDTILNREVAVKVLRGDISQDPVAQLRFQREASAISKMHHPNIVEVYDTGEFEGKSYLVMEYVRGKTLKQLIRQRGALPVAEAVSIMQQLTSAVSHAHEKNIIHRDIKPQNVLVKDDGTVKVTDFGIALAHDAIQLTNADNVLGSAHYIAPEVTKGENATAQVDIYALGVVFFELLSGFVPYNGENPVQVAMKHMREDFPSIRAINSTVPQSVENIISRATAKNRALRYPNGKEMLFDLEVCLRPEFANVDKLTYDETETDKTIMFDTSKINDDKPKETKEEEEPTKSPLWRKVVAAIAVVSLLTAGITLGVYYTGVIDGFGPTEYISTPNLDGVSQEEAAKILESKGLTLDTEVKKKLTDDVSAGLIVEQSPKANKKIKKGGVVSITISSGTYFTVEDYTGQKLSDIRATLEQNKIEILVDMVSTTTSAPGTIIEQSLLKEGDKVDPSKKRQIRFSVADAPEIVLQNYQGQRVYDVKDSLNQQGIEVSLQVIARPVGQEDVPSFTVVRQSPNANSLYKQDGDGKVVILYYYE